MAEDVLKGLRNRFGREAPQPLSESVNHVRTCSRCERLFLVAYEASADESDRINPNLPKAMLLSAKYVWLIVKELLPEFRQCVDWPIEV
ncbi:MAG: hypothetical protein WBY93_00080 [Candidatus Binatus sp.]